MQQELFNDLPPKKKPPKVSNALKGYMEQHFDFGTLKKMGFYPKDMKRNDYEGQAKIICHMFSLESVYDYSKHEIRCHLSYAGNRPMKINEEGKMQEEPFVTVINPNPLHI